MSAQIVVGCVVCGTATNRFLCGDERAGTGCLGDLLRQLGNCAALVDELNVVLSKRAKTGSGSVGYVSNGGDEQPIPADLKAIEVGTWLRDRLCSWARALWEDNAPRGADGSVPVIDVAPDIVPVARWLMRHPTWIALHPAVDELYGELTSDMAAAWRVANFSSAAVKYVGPCLVDIEGEQCPGDLYAHEDAWTVVCRVCGTEHATVDERREELANAVEHQYVPLGLLVGLVTGRGHRLTTSMIRNLRARGRITSYVRDRDVAQDFYGFRVREWTPDDDGLERLFKVGEVLEVITVNRWKRQVA